MTDVGQPPGGEPIIRISAHLLDVPIGPEVRTRIGSFSHCQFVVTTVESDAGTGTYYVWSPWKAVARSVQHLIQHVAGPLIGTDASDIVGARGVMEQALRLSGRIGLGNYAIGAIDAALWDLNGRAAGVPLWKQLGGTSSSRLDCYRTGMFLSSDIDALQREATSYRSEGYRALKMNIGIGSIEEDLRRIDAVIQSCDGDISLAVDAVSAFDLQTATAYAEALADYNLLWFEDPVDYREGLHLDDLRTLRENSPIPIAAGEFALGETTLRHMVDQGAVDILMVDLQHVGGITPWVEATRYAMARDVRAGTHVFTEAAAHIAISERIDTPVEVVPWSYQLFGSTPRLVHEQLIVSEGHGLGLQLSEAATRDMKNAESLGIASP